MIRDGNLGLSFHLPSGYLSYDPSCMLAVLLVHGPARGCRAYAMPNNFPYPCLKDTV